MPKVSRAHMEKQRSRILLAASKCFVAKGVAATSVQDICLESGLSVGGIYRHFENKQAIVSELFAASDDMNRGSLGAADEATAPEANAPLGVVLRHLLAEFASAQAPHVVRLSLAMHAEALRDELIASAAQRQLLYVRDAFGKAVRAAQNRGQVGQHIDPESTAVVLVALFEGLKPILALDPELDLDKVSDTLGLLLPELFDA